MITSKITDIITKREKEQPPKLVLMNSFLKRPHILESLNSFTPFVKLDNLRISVIAPASSGLSLRQIKAR